MNTDEKILQALEAQGKAIKAINTRLDGMQADITVMKDEVAKIPDQHGKILIVLTDNMATVLEEQQQQRTDIRAVPAALEVAKEELRTEILAARAENKADNMDLKASMIRRLKEDEKWIEAIAEKTGTPNPSKH